MKRPYMLLASALALAGCAGDATHTPVASARIAYPHVVARVDPLQMTFNRTNGQFGYQISCVTQGSYLAQQLTMTTSRPDNPARPAETEFAGLPATADAPAMCNPGDVLQSSMGDDTFRPGHTLSVSLTITLSKTDTRQINQRYVVGADGELAQQP